MKIITVLGARPQFIKAATVSRAFAGLSDVEEILLHTGQHYDTNMSDIFFKELGISFPQYHLGVSGGEHGEMTGRQLEKIERVLLDENPNLVLVYGDTNSTLAGALAAVKQHIPVVHIEAGLRSFNRKMPEEINRVVTDHVAEILFTPTTTAGINLQSEGISKEKIYQVGDVMYDAVLYFGEVAESKSTIIDRLALKKKSYILSTIHRAENTDDVERLKVVFGALLNLANTFTVVLPLHPRTRKVLESAGLYEKVNDQLILVDPVGYLDMAALEKNSQVIITDSGGVQKEAFFHKVPCVTIRDETEWVELVELGWNRLAPPENEASIITVVEEALANNHRVESQPYGNGKSSEKIASILQEMFN